MNKNIKKNIVKVAVIAMTLVIGTATITYAKHTVRKTEKEVASEDINLAENKLKHKAIKKSINEEADKAIQFSEEKCN